MYRVRAVAIVALLAAVTCNNEAPRQAQPTSSPSPTVSPSPSPSPSSAPEVFRFAAVGDTGDGSPNAASVASAIAAEHSRRPLNLVLLLGDLIYPDGDPAEFEQKYKKIYQPVIDEGVETRATLGNHDIQTDSGQMIRVFEMPARYYAFEGGPASFFAIDSSRGVVDAIQRKWLEEELSKSNKTWKIGFTHVSPHVSGDHGPNLSLQRSLDGLLQHYGVRLLLSGHNHLYERTKEVRGTVHIVSGGGCCPRKSGTSGITAYAASTLHFVVITIAGEEMTIEAIDSEGKVFDRATLTRVATQAA